MSDQKYFQAVALELPADSTSPPTLSARGEHELAAHIIACAKRHGIPVVEKPELCNALAELDIDQTIPSELFKAAAAVLAEVGALISRKPTSL
jgi:flagellar biosynthesis protein